MKNILQFEHVRHHSSSRSMTNSLTNTYHYQIHYHFIRHTIKNIYHRYSRKQENKDLQLYARLSMNAKEPMKRNEDNATRTECISISIAV